MQLKSDRLIRTISLLMFVGIGVLCAPSNAAAQFTDRSDELPGIGDDTALYVIGGVVVAASIGYWLYKRGKEDDSNSEDQGAAQLDASDHLSAAPATAIRERFESPLPTVKPPPFDLIIGTSSTGQSSTSRAVRLGVAFRLP